MLNLSSKKLLGVIGGVAACGFGQAARSQVTTTFSFESSMDRAPATAPVLVHTPVEVIQPQPVVAQTPRRIEIPRTSWSEHRAQHEVATARFRERRAESERFHTQAKESLRVPPLEFSLPSRLGYGPPPRLTLLDGAPTGMKRAKEALEIVSLVVSIANGLQSLSAAQGVGSACEGAAAATNPAAAGQGVSEGIGEAAATSVPAAPAPSSAPAKPASLATQAANVSKAVPDGSNGPDFTPAQRAAFDLAYGEFNPRFSGVQGKGADAVYSFTGRSSGGDSLNLSLFPKPNGDFGFSSVHGDPGSLAQLSLGDWSGALDAGPTWQTGTGPQLSIGASLGRFEACSGTVTTSGQQAAVCVGFGAGRASVGVGAGLELSRSGPYVELSGSWVGAPQCGPDGITARGLKATGSAGVGNYAAKLGSSGFGMATGVFGGELQGVFQTAGPESSAYRWFCNDKLVFPKRP